MMQEIMTTEKEKRRLRSGCIAAAAAAAGARRFDQYFSVPCQFSVRQRKSKHITVLCTLWHVWLNLPVIS